LRRAAEAPMSLTDSQKDDIRTSLLLELNSAFSRVASLYTRDHDNERRAYLITLIESVRECVRGEVGDIEASYS
jgi:hypothetical protein